jgi:putative transposase
MIGLLTKHGHWQTTPFLAALRHDRIDAPCVFDGSINGACFRAWTKQMLAPRLQAGDIVILDNLSSHKVASIKEAIEKNAGRFSSICRPTVQT